MIQFNTNILRFDKQGEKTGWTYIKIPAAIAQKLKPDQKKTFRVKGRLDNHAIKSIALLPMGDGDFIMALNAAIRKSVNKKAGAVLSVQLEPDDKPVPLSKELLECLADEPSALAFFNSLSPSHRLYFSNWIKTAKTQPTKTKRIAQTITALLKRMDFGQMLRSIKADK